MKRRRGPAGHGKELLPWRPENVPHEGSHGQVSGRFQTDFRQISGRFLRQISAEDKIETSQIVTLQEGIGSKQKCENHRKPMYPG